MYVSICYLQEELYFWQVVRVWFTKLFELNDPWNDQGKSWVVLTHKVTCS